MMKLSLNRPLKYLLTVLFLTALAVPSLAGQVTDSIQGKLVKKGSGGELEAYTIETEPQFYVFVFSASSSPECKQELPGLISQYTALKNKNPNSFEFIFVSADDSAEEMKTYMLSEEMPWPGLVYDQRDAAADAKAFSGEGIPSLVLMTKDGRFIKSSYKNKGAGEYQGHPPVFDSLNKLLGLGVGKSGVGEAGKGEAGGEVSEEAIDNATEVADVAAEKLGISGTRFVVGSILALATFLFLFFKN